jgi:hypothetical protein
LLVVGGALGYLVTHFTGKARAARAIPVAQPQGG